VCRTLCTRYLFRSSGQIGGDTLNPIRIAGQREKREFFEELTRRLAGDLGLFGVSEPTRLLASMKFSLGSFDVRSWRVRFETSRVKPRGVRHNFVDRYRAHGMLHMYK
jgi:hypothetical protein